MTEPNDPTTPHHDEPAEGPRDDAYSTPGGAETAGGAGGPGPDPSAGWSSAGGAGSGASAAATSILESLRDAIDDLADRAGPTVREYSARAAEIAAVAADKAAPVARRAGQLTSDASSRLAERSREWAHEVRESLDQAEPGPDGGPAAGTAPEPTDESSTPGASAEGGPLRDQ